ncbi:MAG TPA: tetratricopeptide repeat protein [Candidatus Sulfotelmatobacter sp.]|nr:tetratricopeptide repeat protein [Candidatus Sulfotelmatobacter sp.]
MRRHVANAYDYNAVGVTFCQAGAYDLAIVQLKEAVRLKPAVANYHFNLGGAYYGKGRLADAEYELSEALRLEPGHIKAHWLRALCLEKAGRPAEALIEYRWVRSQAGNSMEGRNASEAIRGLEGPGSLQA